MTDRTLLRQAMAALHPQANRAFVEATRDALRAALAAPVEPVAWHRERFNLPAWVDSLERSIQARKVSAKDVCAATGIVESSLSRIRAGKHAPDAASLAALSAWAGINPVSFCTLVTPQAQPAPAVPAVLDEIELIEAVLAGYPPSMARSDALRSCRVLRGITGDSK